MQANIRTCQEFERSLFCGIFTESAPGLIQSSSRNVRLCVRPNMPSCCLQQMVDILNHFHKIIVLVISVDTKSIDC